MPWLVPIPEGSGLWIMCHVIWDAERIVCWTPIFYSGIVVRVPCYLRNNLAITCHFVCLEVSGFVAIE